MQGPYVSQQIGELKLQDAVVRRGFRRDLLTWYDKNKRDLPWRINRDPYRVWVAEVMLQQTRVAAVIAYYDRFLKRFPTVQRLAVARIDSVLAAWSGLGYYRRARALHESAKRIVRCFDGRFPRSAQEWRDLPGIGRYTAAAIASIAFDQPIAVVDGNVERVLWRIGGRKVRQKQTWELAEKLLSKSRPGDFNQAIMEFGATICLPRQPLCVCCPIRDLCSTRGELAASATPKRKKRQIFYTLNRRDGAVLLTRRGDHSSLMAGMWELPEVATPGSDAAVEVSLRHAITVTDYMVLVYRDRHSDVIGGQWIPQPRVSALPLTGLARKILRTTGVI